MSLTRRHTLLTGAAAWAAAGIGLPSRAWAQVSGIEITPIEHASFVMQTPGMVVYNDPVGGAALYQGQPAPQLILITHEHGDHYDVPTLESLVTENVRLLTNPAVYDMLPEGLKAQAVAIGNGETTSANDIGIEAIPAYNTTEGRLRYHPQGRDNGYILTIGETRVYIAGDTEDIPEMRALTGIDIAFLPMNLPYTMTVEQAASAVAEFKPGIVYPYHYSDSDVTAFKASVEASDAGSEVILGDWY
jgi:L-ascorbate metabolism protein UlaG (beta-lactamase superfamily)